MRLETLRSLRCGKERSWILSRLAAIVMIHVRPCDQPGAASRTDVIYMIRSQPGHRMCNRNTLIFEHLIVSMGRFFCTRHRPPPFGMTCLHITMIPPGPSFIGFILPSLIFLYFFHTEAPVASARNSEIVARSRCQVDPEKRESCLFSFGGFFVFLHVFRSWLAHF